MLIKSSLLCDILSISQYTLLSRKNKGIIKPSYNDGLDDYYDTNDLLMFDEILSMHNSNWNEFISIKPKEEYTLGELFAGGGGLAVGFEKAGFKKTFLNEIDKNACKTLRHNRNDWNVIESDIKSVDFKEYHNKVDVVTGGFPCQAFSYAGKKLGFNDIRGTMFFEFARVMQEVNPKIIVAENVKGLINHDNGNTLKTILNVIDELGYTILEKKLYQMIFYKVPQKRERIIIVAVRKDLANKLTFTQPSVYNRIMTLNDAFYKGELYDSDVPVSNGQEYSQRKKEIMSLVPQGGYWKDLPIDLQKEYLKDSFYLTGGKTGIARRLSLDNPSLTLTCSAAQKQTERCHPIETRPLQIREYARIQTFPDNWEFIGSTSSVYKQIGNAVSVNFAHILACSIVKLLNDMN